VELREVVVRFDALRDMPSTLLLRERIRPTSLAFLLAGPDPSLFLKATQICSVLWGGIYHPIIVLDQTTRVRVGVQEQLGDPAETEILGTLKDFDPDFVVTLGTDTLPPFLASIFRGRHLKESDLTHELRPGQPSGVFLEVWPFLEQFWRDQVRGGPADAGVRIVNAGATGAEVFVAAQFGRYSREGANRLMRERLGAHDCAFDSAFREAFRFTEHWYPIDFTALSIQALGQAAFVNASFFLLDHANLYDVVDYWNLRAAGMVVFPLSASLYRDYAEGVRAFATRTKLNMLMHFDGQVIKARSVSDELLEDVARWASEVSGLQITRRGWYPRFGVKISHVSPDITPVTIEASSSNLIAILENGWGHLLGAAPSCEFDGPAYFQQWSSELDVYSDHEDGHQFHLPWLRPECDRLAARHLGHGYGTEASRVSRSGVVCYRKGDHRDTSIRQIATPDVVKAVLADAGFRFDGLSSSGLAAQRMVAQLGGIHAAGIFRNRGVREVLERLEKGNSLPADEIRATLHRHHQQGICGPGVSTILDRLVERMAIRAGMMFKCESCGRHDWYHISEFDEHFACKSCFSEQRTPRLEGEQWHYRSDGMFALDGRMAGCLSVLLAILHIKTWVTNVHYCTSFNYTDGTQPHEADFMCFVRGFRDEVEVVVGEAKTRQSLDVHEIVRMGSLAARLDAWLVFSKLEGAFSDEDKEHFRNLQADGRRLILLDGPTLEADPDQVMHSRSEAFRMDTSELGRLSALTTDRVIGSSRDQHAPAARLVKLLRRVIVRRLAEGDRGV
jgi:hypothetical protein